MVVLSRAFLHEHFLFFTYVSNHTTRTLSTSCTSPRSPGKLRHQESLWRENQQSGSHRLWGQRTCDNLKNRCLFLRSISIIWCTWKIWWRRSPSSYPRRNGGICKIWDGWCAGFQIIRDVLHPIADAFRRFRRKHCRFRSRRWRVTKMLTSPLYAQKDSGETWCNGHAGERGKCTIHSSRSKGNFEISLIWSSESSEGTRCIVFNWTGKPDQEFCVPNQNDIHIPGCIVGEEHWRLLERAWRKGIVRDMDRIHKILSTKRKATRRIPLVRGETRKQTTSRPDDVWPDMWKFMSDAAKKRAKQRWAIEKPKLENARQLRGIFFIEPNDEEFKLTMKAARRKL